MTRKEFEALANSIGLKVTHNDIGGNVFTADGHRLRLFITRQNGLVEREDEGWLQAVVLGFNLAKEVVSK